MGQWDFKQCHQRCRGPKATACEIDQPVSKIAENLKFIYVCQWGKTFTLKACFFYLSLRLWSCLQCFDAVGWAAGRASGL